MDDDRRYGGRLNDHGAYPVAAFVVLVLAVVIGLGLMSAEGAQIAPAASPVSRAAAPRITTLRPSIAVAPRPTRSPSLFSGLIGLPPEGAVSSTPQVGELVDMYWVAGGGPPYRGTARLYADGRLIWNRYHGTENGQTTGYLEQRLTPEGVDLVKLEKSLVRKDPLELLNRLPLAAWAARTPILYAPSGYGICLQAMDPRPGRTVDEIDIDPAHLITMLPVSVSSLL